MFGRFQRSLTGLVALLTVVAQANEGYLQVAGPVPLRFQEPARPAPPPRPLPPSTPVEQPPAPPVPPISSASPTASPTAPETSEPLGPPAPETSVPSTGVVAPVPQAGSNSSTNRIDTVLRPLTSEGETVSPQALLGYFQPRALGPGRTAVSAVVLNPAVFMPPQPAVPQPSSATYTVKP
ncbi:MAG: hypothetical protein H7X97_04460 [Opitutaceae bacterium]|nr:hypothetical protein [Verrucomicrobiales bacterium]